MFGSSVINRRGRHTRTAPVAGHGAIDCSHFVTLQSPMSNLRLNRIYVVPLSTAPRYGGENAIRHRCDGMVQKF